jgi:hypothetical protein
MAGPPAQPANLPAPGSLTDIQKLQFDYAWKWFNFHADQRVKMFNYMLLAFGIFAAGLINALDKNFPKALVVAFSFAAALLAIVFRLLDRRNRDLVWLGEDVLKDLERTVIFDPNRRIRDSYGRDLPESILTRQDPPLCLCKCGFQNLLLGKHRTLLPLISYLIAALFIGAGIFIWVAWPLPK